MCLGKDRGLALSCPCNERPVSRIFTGAQIDVQADSLAPIALGANDAGDEQVVHEELLAGGIMDDLHG